jgi:hypothetical protein
LCLRWWRWQQKEANNYNRCCGAFAGNWHRRVYADVR